MSTPLACLTTETSFLPRHCLVAFGGHVGVLDAIFKSAFHHLLIIPAARRRFVLFSTTGLSFQSFTVPSLSFPVSQSEIGVMRKPFHVMASQTLLRNDPFQDTVRHRAPLPTDRGQVYRRHSAARFRSFAMPRNNPPLVERLDMS